MSEDCKDSILLKWGNLKGWDLKTDVARAAAMKFADSGIGMSCMQRLNEVQKSALCDLIDAIDGEIMNAWSGEKMTKEEAKKYVMEYGA
jgi:hypothetical protein